MSRRAFKEYAVYQGEELLIIGTAKECAAFMGVTPKYIQWMTTPSARKQFESRKNPDRCTNAIKIEEDDE